jgi:hypothetical protein
MRAEREALICELKKADPNNKLLQASQFKGNLEYSYNYCVQPMSKELWLKVHPHLEKVDGKYLKHLREIGAVE